MSGSSHDSATEPKSVHRGTHRRAYRELLFQDTVLVDKVDSLKEGSEYGWRVDIGAVSFFFLYVDLDPMRRENRLRLDLARIYFESPWRADLADVLLESPSRLDLADKYLDSSWEGFAYGRMVYGSPRPRSLVYLPSRPRSHGLLPASLTEPEEGEEEPHWVVGPRHQRPKELMGWHDNFVNRVRRSPSLLLRRTLQATLLLLIATLLSLAFVPLATPFFVAAILILYGGAVLTDAVIRERPFHDPRVGTLLLISGLGTLVVAAVGLVTR